MTTLKKITAGIMILALAGAGYGWYLYNKKPADIRKLAADKEITAGHLLEDFAKDEVLAGKQYIGKVLIVSGSVANIQSDTAGLATVILDTGNPMASVICSFYPDETSSVKKVAAGTAVRIKGECTGLLMDVIINKCSMMP